MVVSPSNKQKRDGGEALLVVDFVACKWIWCSQIGFSTKSTKRSGRFLTLKSIQSYLDYRELAMKESSLVDIGQEGEGDRVDNQERNP